MANMRILLGKSLNDSGLTSYQLCFKKIGPLYSPTTMALRWAITRTVTPWSILLRAHLELAHSTCIVFMLVFGEKPLQ